MVEHFSNLDCPVSRSTELLDPQMEPEVKADSLSNTLNTRSNNKSHDDNAVPIDVISSAYWFLHTKLNDKEMPMLFDTGSPVSIISVETYESLGASKPDLQAVDRKLFTAIAQSYQLKERQIFILKLRQRVIDGALWW